MTHTITADDIERLYSGGYFVNDDEYHTPDGRTIMLGVPLCVGCDRPLDDGHCDACELSAHDFWKRHGFIERIEERPLGNGWNRWAA